MKALVCTFCLRAKTRKKHSVGRCTHLVCMENSCTCTRERIRKINLPKCSWPVHLNRMYSTTRNSSKFQSLNAHHLGQLKYTMWKTIQVEYFPFKGWTTTCSVKTKKSKQSQAYKSLLIGTFLFHFCFTVFFIGVWKSNGFQLLNEKRPTAFLFCGSLVTLHLFYATWIKATGGCIFPAIRHEVGQNMMAVSVVFQSSSLGVFPDGMDWSLLTLQAGLGKGEKHTSSVLWEGTHWRVMAIPCRYFCSPCAQYEVLSSFCDSKISLDAGSPSAVYQCLVFVWSCMWKMYHAQFILQEKYSTSMQCSFSRRIHFKLTLQRKTNSCPNHTSYKAAVL